MRFTASVTREGKLFVAQCLEVDIASQGETFDEAISNLREAMQLLYEDSAAPDVSPPIIAPFDVALAGA